MWPIVLKVFAFLMGKPLLFAGLGIAVGYFGGKVGGYFECRSDVAAATERARADALQRDLEIAKDVAKLDKELAAKLAKELKKAREKANEIGKSSDCSISKSDARKLRNIR